MPETSTNVDIPEATREQLAAAVDRFFDRVSEEPLLSLYFEQTDMTSIKERFRRYMECCLVDKEEAYEGKDIYNAHTGRGIIGEAVDFFIEKFVDTLKESELSAGDIEKLEGKLWDVRNLVVDKFVPSGEYVYKPQRFG